MSLFSSDHLPVERVSVAIPSLPSAFDGYRVVLLTDLHFDAPGHRRLVAHAVALTLDLSPNLIVLTGDYVSHWSAVPGLAGHLRPLNSPDGVWTTLGNHDHWSGAARIRRALSEAGITELQNASVPIRRAGQSIWLAGVDDVWMERHDLRRALEGIPDGAVTILLAHEPDYADEVALTGRVALQLSGHSHGGQIQLPGLTPHSLPHLGQKYPAGLYRVQDMWLYTSRGVGCGLLPRIRSRPEITEITLRQSEDAG
jgi:predicted MPP superfamily phosphohydrolase